MLFPGGFSNLKDYKKYNSYWKKLLGFRNLQEKLEKEDFSLNACLAKYTHEVRLYVHYTKWYLP